MNTFTINFKNAESNYNKVIDAKHLKLVVKFMTNRAAVLAWQEAVEDADVRMPIEAYRKVNKAALAAMRKLQELNVLSKYDVDMEIEIV